MSSSFTRKRIDVTFQLGVGQFGTSGFNTIKVSGLRTQVDIAKAGGSFKGALSLRIFGLDLPTMNQLSHVGRLASSVTQNVVTIEAGDDVIGMANIYQGSIYQAWADFQGQPEVAFTVEAASGAFEAVQPVAPSSYQGSVDAAVIMNNLAASMKKNFSNNGVSAILHDQYLQGTYYQQADQCALAGGFSWTIDNPNILAIWPVDGFRALINSDIPLISPSSGLVGYPKFNATGITLTTLFDPRITLGAQIKVESSIDKANGIWRVNQMGHNLESERPNGSWFTTVECASLDRIVLP